jgi:hypothetical protein
MTDEELAELEASAEAYGKGEWPAGKTTRQGRPPLYDDELMLPDQKGGHHAGNCL